jgi:ferrochelatase
MSKTAVVLFNLGGPDSPKAVQTFLFNLFNDKAIIGLPQPLRMLAAKLIAGRRTKAARAIYQHMGGKSPLLEQTQAQAEALENLLTIKG